MLYKKRMLFSYITILLFSIISSNILFFISVSSREKTLNMEYSQVQVKQLKNAFDYVLNSISQDLIYLSYQYEIQKLGEWYKNSTYRDKKKFLSEFNPFSTINEYYSEAFLVNPADGVVLDIKNKIFTTIDSSRFSRAINLLLSTDKSYLQEKAYTVNISDGDTYTIYLVKPIFNRGNGTKSFIYLALSDYLFKEVFDELFIANNSFVIISDSSNNLLQYRSEENIKLNMDINTLSGLRNCLDGSFIYNFEYETYYINYSSSSSFDLTYYYGTSMNKIQNSILKVLISSIFVSLLIFFILVFVMSQLTNKLYQPITSMLKLLNLDDSVDMKDEFSAIQNNISQLLERSKALQVNKIKGSSFKRSAFIKDLVINDKIKNDEVKVDPGQYSLDILTQNSSVYYICACFIKPGEGGLHLDYTEIRSGMKNTLFMDQFIISEDVHYDFFLDSERVLVFILSTDIRKELSDELLICRPDVKNHFFLCFSDPHYQLHELHEAYEEAMITLDYRTLVQDEASINYKDVIRNRANTFFYPFEVELKLINSLKQQNRDDVMVHFSLFTKTTLRSGISFQKFRYIFFHLLDSIMKVAKDFDIPNEYLLINSEIGNNWDLLEKNSTSEEIINFFSDLLSRIIDYFNNEQKAPNIIIAESVRDFIDSNFTNRNLSLDLIADELRYSISHISNIFKSSYGETIKNYITALRLEKAKDLLINSKMKISSIGGESGYSNVGSFVKIFKAYIGETPKTYRLRIQRK